MFLPAMERSLSIVSGLYATKPGCISIATFTPWSAANLACFVQYGATTLSHCQASTSRYSGGHGQVTQFGYLALGPSPGQPLKSTTTGTPSFSASWIVFRLVSWSRFARAWSGCNGLPWQLNALIVNPLSESFFLKSISSVLLS